MNSADIKHRLDDLKRQVEPLQEQLYKLEAQYRKALSIEWVAANKVTRDQVHDPKDFNEWFGHIGRFADHIRTIKPHRKWLAWNGNIYNTTEILAGRFGRNPIGLLEDVP